jgi:LmbE family N-acetylglucosaminyl deacetylase
MEIKLFILAHPDDEVMCLPSIYSVENLDSIYVLYLTNGTPKGANFDVARRIREAQTASLLLRYAPNVHFFGAEANIRDGNLALDLEKTDYLRLFDFVAKLKPTSIFTTILEGGHQDHDAAYFVANKIAKKLNLSLIAFPCYSQSRYFPFYQTMSTSKEHSNTKMNLMERLYITKLSLKIMRIYSSQKRTWFGLGLFILYRYAFGGSILIHNSNTRTSDISKFLYEKRGKFKHSFLLDFEKKIDAW